MFIREITFSFGHSMPLEVITKNPNDKYASVKPHVSAKAEFCPEECDPTTPEGQALIDNAFELLSGTVLEKAVKFKKGFEEFAKPD